MKKKKNFKGFTLIELIIVMAIFGILLTGVMTLIDPVSKTMRNTSVQESNASSVNNVKNYLENALKYSEYIAVYDGGYTVADTSVVGGRIFKNRADREEAVKEFVTNYFKNRVDSNEDPLKGTVRVLEIDNANGGVISEAAYSFKAPQTYTDGTIEYTISSVSVTQTEALHDAINDVYYDHYSYYIKAGYNQSQPLSTTEAEAAPYNLATSPDGRFYYTKLYEVMDDTGTSSLYGFGSSMFSLSIMTYENDGGFIGSFDVPDDPSTTSYNETQTVQVFRSPVYLANSTMSLPNITSGTVFKDVYGIERDSSGNKIIDGTTGKTKYYKLDSTNGHLLEPRVAVYEPPVGSNAGEEDNLYFIYVLPKDVTR